MTIIAAAIPTWGIVMIIVLVILIGLLVFLTIYGRKLEKQSNEAKQQMDANKQTVSALIIDKKMKKMKESGLPPMVIEQVPKYMLGRKVPVVKVKIGPRVMTMLADNSVFEVLPLKTECKIVISGIYITEIKSVRGGQIPKAEPKKKNIFQKLSEKAAEAKKKSDAAAAGQKTPKRSISENAGTKKKK